MACLPHFDGPLPWLAGVGGELDLALVVGGEGLPGFRGILGRVDDHGSLGHGFPAVVAGLEVDLGFYGVVDAGSMGSGRGRG